MNWRNLDLGWFLLDFNNLLLLELLLSRFPLLLLAILLLLRYQLLLALCLYLQHKRLSLRPSLLPLTPLPLEQVLFLRLNSLHETSSLLVLPFL